ncbi:MAG: ATP-binding cassette domain-containing protein [Alphaproteobacteria bacterium]|nr:ATP-binding cassette domain-containing protein [Alphaproteobacteria bacterium]
MKNGQQAIRVTVARKAFPPVADRPEQLVLSGVDLAVEEGSFVVLTGPSGCGKSTLLNIVAGLDKDYSGKLEFGHRDARLSFMFQTPRLLPWRTVEQNIRYVLDDDDADADAKVAAILERVGLSASANAYPERLSLGMQRRAALARAFVVEPDILLMDEPFVSLDDPSADSLRALLIELWNRRPTTVLFVTHDRIEAVMLATRLVRLGGTPAGIVQDSEVKLSPTERLDREKVLAARLRLFENA